MIITDESKLRSECQDVSIFEANDIISKLEEELKSSKNTGIGLAANQIGIDKKVCIIRVGSLSLNLANPIITEKEDLCLFRNEGCLSFPDQYLLTKRYNEILVIDMLFPAGRIFSGYEAVAVQHEIDHLNGKTMFDYKIIRPKKSMKCWCGSGKVYKKCHCGKVISY